MLLLQLSISSLTILAFWLVTHWQYYRLGLFVALVSEFSWIFYLSYTSQWGLVIVPICMLAVILYRIFDKPRFWRR